MENAIIEFAENLVVNNSIGLMIFFFVSQSLQILFPPYPGDMVLILEGYLSSLGNLPVILIIINAICATFLSSILLYHIGKKEKEKILESKLIKWLFNVKIVSNLRTLFSKYGAAAIIISKFIPGVFSITVLCAGIFQVNKKYAYFAILIITTIHHTVLIMLGKVLQENWRTVFLKLNTYNKYVIVLGVLGIIIYGSMYLLRKKLLN
ncbi:DedA family protein [Caldisalinibacter kiritimatiensis]|uniref:VTT domain-containing protein n=1 Tax=Caldisalinibacter kiritimatiensis TaxID=1304284 RepID=R1CG97_9FIRM|nr:DedA family protein [Caldisalinibacter kiritimatiensis]EOD01345.1 hypothetical protein L21TH_0566 [Caldisalinibacter kiritimatiensis]